MRQVYWLKSISPEGLAERVLKMQKKPVSDDKMFKISGTQHIQDWVYSISDCQIESESTRKMQNCHPLCNSYKSASRVLWSLVWNQLIAAVKEDRVGKSPPRVGNSGEVCFFSFTLLSLRLSQGIILILITRNTAINNNNNILDQIRYSNGNGNGNGSVPLATSTA